jgi:hypothetical protein
MPRTVAVFGCYYADRPSADRVRRVAIARSFLPNGESKMFASENCSKIGCLLESALPGVAPAVALICMLSIAAFSCWAM